LGKVYFAVFGSGLGHATRVLEMATLVGAAGSRVRCSSSGQGLQYIRTRAPTMDTVESPPFDVEWTEEGSFSSGEFLKHFPFMLRSFLKQVTFEAESISRFRPAVVMSDSRLSAVLAGSILSCPVVTILNQFKINLPPRFRGNAVARFYERIGGDVLGLMWSLSAELLLTDLPPPYTIGEANVAGTDLSKTVRYVGFTSPAREVSDGMLSKAKEAVGFDGRPLVFFQISGPDATKDLLIETSIRAASRLSASYKVVVSKGYLGGSGEPQRLAGGVLVYDWCPIKDELFMLADAVVARSGHRTIGQCIDAGKPAVLVPIHNHSEQLGNADKFQRLGLGIAIPQRGLSAERLAESVERCVQDDRYRRSVEAVGRVSKRYNGIEKCAEILESYS